MNVEIHGENMSFYAPIICTMDLNRKDDKYEKFVHQFFILELANSLGSFTLVICDVG